LLVLYTLYDILSIVTNVIVMLVIVQFIIGLLLAFNVINTSNQFVTAIYQSINSLMEPVLAPIRRLLPSTGAIDFSPLVLIIGLQILMVIIGNVIQSAA
jgi:YggT family protein